MKEINLSSGSRTSVANDEFHLATVIALSTIINSEIHDAEDKGKVLKIRDAEVFVEVHGQNGAFVSCAGLIYYDDEIATTTFPTSSSTVQTLEGLVDAAIANAGFQLVLDKPKFARITGSSGRWVTRHRMNITKIMNDYIQSNLGDIRDTEENDDLYFSVLVNQVSSGHTVAWTGGCIIDYDEIEHPNRKRRTIQFN